MLIPRLGYKRPWLHLCSNTLAFVLTKAWLLCYELFSYREVHIIRSWGKHLVNSWKGTDAHRPKTCEKLNSANKQTNDLMSESSLSQVLRWLHYGVILALEKSRARRPSEIAPRATETVRYRGKKVCCFKPENFRGNCYVQIDKW